MARTGDFDLTEKEIREAVNAKAIEEGVKADKAWMETVAKADAYYAATTGASSSSTSYHPSSPWVPQQPQGSFNIIPPVAPNPGDMVQVIQMLVDLTESVTDKLEAIQERLLELEVQLDDIRCNL